MCSMWRIIELSMACYIVGKKEKNRRMFIAKEAIDFQGRRLVFFSFLIQSFFQLFKFLCNDGFEMVETSV